VPEAHTRSGIARGLAHAAPFGGCFAVVAMNHRTRIARDRDHKRRMLPSCFEGIILIIAVEIGFGLRGLTMKNIAFLVLLCVFCKIADAQSAIPGREERNERKPPHACLRINPTNGVIPVRSSATAFSDSPLNVDVNANLEIGANPAPDSANGGLTMVGNLAISHILEVHNNYAVGIDLYAHSDADFRAPYINLYKTRGTQTAPTPVMFTGYEMDSIGGINFGGWDGSEYFPGAAIYSQSDEDWSDTHHGGHVSIYGTNPGGNTQQLAQFGGVDPNGNPYVGNIIFYRPLTWGSNSAANVGLFPVGSERTLKVRTADDSADANLTAGSFIESTSHTPSSANDRCTTGQIAWDATFIYVCVAPNMWKRATISSW
jgi:hypothetical protein